MKTLMFFFVIALTLIISVPGGKAADSNVDAAFRVQSYTGNIMAPDFSLQDLTGQNVKLSDYKGNIVMLGFFTTW